MAAIDVGRALVAALGRRDWSTLTDCFAPDATLRALTPGPLREESGPQEAAARYAHWFGTLEEFEVLESDVVEIADRIRIRYRIRGCDPQHGWQENEHTAYAAVDGERIATMALTCTGFRPTAGC
jgi:SnoaL-like domain